MQPGYSDNRSISANTIGTIPSGAGAALNGSRAAYRQVLRDLPQHPNWPGLQPEDWLTKPKELKNE